MLKRAKLIVALSVILSVTNIGYASADGGWAYASYLNKFQIELSDVWRDYCIIDDCSF